MCGDKVCLRILTVILCYSNESVYFMEVKR